MAELDAVIKGISLAILWEAKEVALRADSATVFNWIRDALSGRARLRSKAQVEMLIRHRLWVVPQLVEEFGLNVDVALVRSRENPADALTRVPRQWLQELDWTTHSGDLSNISARKPGASCIASVAEKPHQI